MKVGDGLLINSAPNLQMESFVGLVGVILEIEAGVISVSFKDLDVVVKLSTLNISRGFYTLLPAKKLVYGTY